MPSCLTSGSFLSLRMAPGQPAYRKSAGNCRKGTHRYDKSKHGYQHNGSTKPVQRSGDRPCLLPVLHAAWRASSTRNLLAPLQNRTTPGRWRGARIARARRFQYRHSASVPISGDGPLSTHRGRPPTWRYVGEHHRSIAVQVSEWACALAPADQSVIDSELDVI